MCSPWPSDASEDRVNCPLVKRIDFEQVVAKREHGSRSSSESKIPGFMQKSNGGFSRTAVTPKLPKRATSTREIITRNAVVILPKKLFNENVHE